MSFIHRFHENDEAHLLIAVGTVGMGGAKERAALRKPALLQKTIQPPHLEILRSQKLRTLAHSSHRVSLFRF
jgi:hypothetical protein